MFENLQRLRGCGPIIGVNVHPGSAKNVMVNAGQVADGVQRAAAELRHAALYRGLRGLFPPHGDSGTAERAELR